MREDGLGNVQRLLVDDKFRHARALAAQLPEISPWR